MLESKNCERSLENKAVTRNKYTHIYIFQIVYSSKILFFVEKKIESFFNRSRPILFLFSFFLFHSTETFQLFFTFLSKILFDKSWLKKKNKVYKNFLKPDARYLPNISPKKKTDLSAENKGKEEKKNYFNAQSTRERSNSNSLENIIRFLRLSRDLYRRSARSRVASSSSSSSRGPRTRRVAVLGEKVLRQADTGIAGRNGLKRATGQSRSFARIYGNRFTRLTKECRLPLRLSTCPRTDRPQHGEHRPALAPLPLPLPLSASFFGSLGISD